MRIKSFLMTLLLLLQGALTLSAQKNTLSIQDISIAPGGTMELPVILDNTADVVALQFTLSIPKEFTISTTTATLTNRSEDHVVTMQEIASRKYMVMVYSPTNKNINGRTGKVMGVRMNASGTVTEGSQYTLTLSDVVITARDGRNIATGYQTGKVKIDKSPDLEISNLKCEATTITPGEKLTASWTVTNVGAFSTEDGWAENVYLDGPDGTSAFVGSVRYDECLASQSVVTRTVDVSVPEVLGIDGKCRLRVKLVPTSSTGEPVGYQENNTAVSERMVDVAKRIYVSPGLANLTEGSSAVTRLLLSRSGRTSMSETFALSLSSADSRVSVPETVTIEGGQSAAYFYISTQANGVLDDIPTIDLTISGEGVEEASARLAIEDDTYPSLYITTDEQEVTEGSEITFTITTQRISSDDVEIKMTCDFASRFKIPSNIVIPAGQSRVNVTVAAIEDDIPNAEEVVTFSVNAARHNAASVYTTLVDNDIPTLQLEIMPSAVSEAAGPLAVTAKLRRTDNIDKVVTVRFSDDSDGGIYYGRQTITLEKGIEEATVNLGPIDNAIVDGERTYNISAAVWIASCSCNANNSTSGGVVSVPLTVYDNDGPTLTLSSTSSMLMEGGEMSVVVKRNTDSSNPLVVNIVSDHDADLVYPNTVTIPIGETAMSFIVKSKGNEITDDGFTATLSAKADGFATGNIWFAVSDQTLPDAQIVDFSVSAEEVEAGGVVSVEVTIANTGSYDLPELTKIGIYTSNASSAASTLYLQNHLPAGETIVMKKEITMPSAIGEYNVYAVVNDGNGTKELSTKNNASKMLRIRTVSPFSVRIESDKAVYKLGDKALLSGKIIGSDVAEKEVEVYVVNDSYRHIINTKTDSDGAFSVEYEPYSGQIGHFVAGACYPKEGLRTEMLAFDYYGIKRVSNAAITCEALLGDSYTGRYKISNPGNLPLSDVSVNVVSQPNNCDVTVNCPSSISANSTFEVEYTIDATSVSEGTSWQQIELNLTTAEGVSLPTTLYYYCKNKQGQLKTDITRIKTTMIKGSSRDYPFVITNTGKGETGKITIEIPSWMSLVTPREMSSLNSGESATVILRLTPAETMQLNVPVSGAIGLNCANGQGMSLPFYIEPVSESTGTMIIDVCDESTYYTAEKPHLAGAAVTISHPATGATITSGTTGVDGTFRAVLPEGYYSVNVSAANHNSYRNNLLVDPGVENVTTVNLSFEAITVDWKVEETTVQDEYSVVTTVSYETSVPVPVVELSVPNSIDAKSLTEGESLIFYATLTNKGLITAEDVQLELPTGFRALMFEALSNNEPFSLAPQQSVLIPVKVTHVGEDVAKSMNRVKPIDDDPCIGHVGTLYYWECGTDRKWHRYKVALQVGTCKSNDPSTWGNSGSGTYGSSGLRFGGIGAEVFGNRPSGSVGGGYQGSSSGSSNVTSHKDEGCAPCQNKFIIDLVDCGLQLVPAYKVLKQVIDCVRKIRKVIGIAKSGNIKDIAYGTLEATTSCIAAKRAGAGDKNVTREAKREEALEDILLTLSSLKAQQGLGEDFDGEDVIETLGSLASSLAALAGFDFDKLEEIFCPVKLFLPCEYEGDEEEENDSAHDKKSKAAAKDVTPSYVTEFRQNLAYPFIQQLTLIGLSYEFFGDADWMDIDQDQLFTFYDTFIASQDSEGIVSEEYYEPLLKAKPESISRDQVIKFVKRWNNTLKGNEDEPHFDCDKIVDFYDMIESVSSAIVDKGFESVAELYEASFEKCKARAEESKSVCASISLQFAQKMVMTRQAFRGTLTVYNGNEDTAMTDVKLSLVVKDENGNVATSHEFQIAPESLTGFDGQLDSADGWTLDAEQTGVATILFIPTKFAAPEAPKRYSFAGSLTYTDPFTGLTVTRDLAPITLTVNPSPDLELTYFMQRDIMGDDPLTEVVEPCEEAEFSLLINNVGYGDATDVRMFTEQPEIIDNEKGLLVDFELISSQLNGGDKTLALGGTVATDFGTIPAKSTSYAQWWIKSSLLGHFTDYNVEATHVTSYGNPDLSLLGDVTIHELIRSIDVESAGNHLVGFMTNDIVDAEDMPDMLYLSNGETADVTLAQNVEIHKTSTTEYTLKVDAPDMGWTYGNVVDPTYGISALKSVVRQSDGKEMPLRNFWQTDRTLRDGQDPLYENRIHFADNLLTTSDSYILTFEPTPELRLDIASIEGVPEEGSLSIEPVESLRVLFNKEVNPATFTTDDITIAVQGKQLDASLIDVTTEDNKYFSLDFTRLNEVAGNGYYYLSIQTAEVMDTEGYSGHTGKYVGWIMFKGGFVQLETSNYPTDGGQVERVDDPSSTMRRAAEVEAEEKAEYGSKIMLKAIPNIGYQFANWTVNGEEVSQSPVLEYPAICDVHAVANYSIMTYSVSLKDISEGGRITGTASGIYNYGQSLTFMAETDDDFVFQGWKVNGTFTSEESILTIDVLGKTEIEAVFVRDVYEQRVTLTRGWNWVSSYLTEPMEITRFYSAAKRIVGQTEECTLDPILGMVGNLEKIEAGQSYKINAAYATTQSFKGHLHNSEDNPLVVKKGWNWISYPYHEARQLDGVIANPDEGDVIAAYDAFAEYGEGYWEGSLISMLPGEGYIYKSESDKTLQFVFNPVAYNGQHRVVADDDVTDIAVVTYGKYPNTMNLTARIADASFADESEHYVLYAFAGDECRGNSRFVGENHYLTVHGDVPVYVTFVAVDTENGLAYPIKESLTFADGNVGSRKNPYVMHIDHDANSIANVDSNVQNMDVYRIDGVRILTGADNQAIRHLPKGVYLINGAKYITR